MESILVVEDCPDAQAQVERALTGLKVHFAGSLAEARKKLEALQDLCLVLLDLGLPDGNGFSLCSEIAATGGPRVPVIFLTGSDDTRDLVTAFSLGADDYIQKPFVSLELRARVMGRLRRRTEEHDRILEIGPLTIDLDQMRTYLRGEDGRSEIVLTPIEHRLVHALVENPGRLMTRQSLISRVWADAIVGPRTVDTHVSNLRAKLGADCIEIEAVRGVGYRAFERRQELG